MSAAPRIVMGGASPSLSSNADVRAAARAAAPQSPSSAALGWMLLGWVGLVFVATGLVDLAIGWFPSHFGNPEWEFGTVARTLDSLPTIVLGLAVVLAAAVERRLIWGARAASAACWLLAALLAASLVVFLLDVPVALKAVLDPAAKAGLDRVIAKALVQGVLYPSVLLAIGWQGVRATRRARALA